MIRPFEEQQSTTLAAALDVVFGEPPAPIPTREELERTVVRLRSENRHLRACAAALEDELYGAERERQARYRQAEDRVARARERGAEPEDRI